MKRCAFLTMTGIEAFECYDHLLYDPLAELGWKAVPVPWREIDVNWDDFEAVIIRSPWDYQDDPDLFLDLLETIDASSARLENSLDIIRWNIDKTYLRNMQDAGIPIVPTLWEAAFTPGTIPRYFNQFSCDEFIIKPTISANADDTYRLSPPVDETTLRTLEKTFSRRPFMVQPFVKAICNEGEFSLFYFGGSYSHAILKTPAYGDFRVQEEHGGTLAQIKPEPELLKISNKTMQALPEIPLYARVDFVRGNDNQFQLIELELIEPSLYFNMDPNSPRRFATAFDRWMND